MEKVNHIEFREDKVFLAINKFKYTIYSKYMTNHYVKNMLYYLILNL